MNRKNGSWTIKSTEKIFENDFFKVFEDEVIKPNGGDGTYATIDLPPGVAILPIDDDGYVYITRQFRYALGEKSTEVAAGSVDDEEPLDAAKRELKEELGIQADEWVDLGKALAITGITNSLTHLYIARKLTFGEEQSESTEEIETVKMKLDELIEKVVNGEITHGKTCILALKAAFRK